MIEKRWAAIAPISLIADGTTDGYIILSTTAGFKTKQEVILKATGEETLALQIKRVLSNTQLLVGPRGTKLSVFSDISIYTTAKNATLEAYEQPRPDIPLQEIQRAIFEEEPAVAQRTIAVDQWGQPYSDSNPLPIAGLTSDNLNGPASQKVIEITDLIVSEALTDLTPLTDRKVVTIQPLTGKIYVYFGDGVTVPDAASVAANGFIMMKLQKETYEASPNQHLYLLAFSGSVNVALAERA